MWGLLYTRSGAPQSTLYPVEGTMFCNPTSNVYNKVNNTPSEVYKVKAWYEEYINNSTL